MKKQSKKQMKGNRGITLVALVVTIVVLLILAGITISTLFGENGIISAARKAAEDTAKDQTDTDQGIKDLTDEMNKEINGGLNASLIYKNASKYYGKKVNNYVAGSQAFQTSLGIDWKIFYADSDHIYLIASDYVPVNSLPYSTDINGNVTTNKPTSDNGQYPVVDNVSKDYTGSNRISEEVKYLNKSYFDYLKSSNEESTYNNIKKVAYMLDTKAWKGFKDSTGKADFVIGGPTVEMLFNSYCQKNNLVNSSGANKYQARATSSIGYAVSSDYGISWKDDISEKLSVSDSLYVNTTGYIVASPSGRGEDGIMHIAENGFTYNSAGVTYSGFGSFSFRPLVALKSNVVLIEQQDGSFNIK